MMITFENSDDTTEPVSEVKVRHELFCAKGSQAAPNPSCVLVVTFWRDGLND